MSLLRPFPSSWKRPLTALVLGLWAAQMGVLLHAVYRQSPVALAADLARYGSGAQWKGIYYRGEKIGFAVSQTETRADGYELREDARLQMNLFGATTAVGLTSVAVVDPSFALRSFSASIDPGTGKTEVSGALDGARVHLKLKTPSGETEETRTLDAPPALELNLPRTLAARGLREGQTLRVHVFNPTTLVNEPQDIRVERREVVEAASRSVPAFKVVSRSPTGIASVSWITDTGEVVRQETPLGLLVVRETPEQAQALAVPGKIQADMLEAAALAPRLPQRIDDPRAVRRLRVRLSPLGSFDPRDLQGAGQSVAGDVLEVTDARGLLAERLDPERARFLGAEPLLESDAPEIQDEARKATSGLLGDRARAERLVRHVNALVEKKPTISLPSAREVLRTRVGDCNEHTALYVALARALAIPARTAVGLVHLHGAFYYHAWAEVYLEENGRGLWLPVDPTLNEFPANATHLRLSRGGLEKQAAIVGFVGRASMSVLDLEVDKTATPVLVGAAPADRAAPFIALPRRADRGCWSSPGR